VHARWLEEAERVDLAVYGAIAQTETPALDRALSRLSRAADYSRLSIASAGVLSVAGGPRGRRAARVGLSCLAVTAVVVNAGLKPLARRRRPDRAARAAPPGWQVRMPASRSMPSGHTAAAFALAAVVGYSRVHTGVHYPSDVVAGALLGSAIAQGTARLVASRG